MHCDVCIDLIYVREEMKTKGAALARFQRKCANMDRVTSQRKQAGNDCFKAGDFRGAISAYTEAIERRCVTPADVIWAELWI